MSSSALALVVLAALIHATWNLLVKRAAAAGPAFVLAYTVVSCLAYLPWVVWLLMTDPPPWSLAALVCILASGVLHLAYSLFLQRGYQVADLSVVYPVARGSGPMLSTMGAFMLLGETPSASGIAGLLAVVIGIVLIASQGRWAVFVGPAARTGIRWGLATGAMIAAYTVVDAWGVKALALAPVLIDWGSNVFRFAALLPWVAPRRQAAMAAMHGHWWLAFWVGVLSPLSYILVLTALELGAPLSLTAPAREMSMMVGALLAMAVLGERVGPWRLAGCGLVIAGVVALGRA